MPARRMNGLGMNGMPATGVNASAAQQLRIPAIITLPNSGGCAKSAWRQSWNGCNIWRKNTRGKAGVAERLGQRGKNTRGRAGTGGQLELGDPVPGLGTTGNGVPGNTTRKTNRQTRGGAAHKPPTARPRPDHGEIHHRDLAVV